MTTTTTTAVSNTPSTATSTAASTATAEPMPVHTDDAFLDCPSQDLCVCNDRNFIERQWDAFVGAARKHWDDEEGMSTIEYALGCVAAAALGALLYTVVTSDTVEQALSQIFERALNQG
ncbi:DUF4244 domain-containing protein [Corynebacterium falsenii]|uniref:DUF4244 domain-containing protein n=1 Tax=Corynebacterium falsenii TaxID=108486 RepID=UPI003FD241AC